MTTQRPLSVQTVKKMPSGKWEVARYGWCPDHKDSRGFPQRSTNYQGEDEFGWLFRCPDGKTHTTHLFHNRKPRNLPKTAAEAALWMQMEIGKMVTDPKRAGQ